MPDSECEIDYKAFEIFTEELKEYVANELNELKIMIDSIAFCCIKDRGDLPLLTFRIEIAAKIIYQLNNKIYQYGHCINCGKENELNKCSRCDQIYPADEGNSEFCDCYLSKIETK